ncbi:MAG: LysR family transcriptional regulator [Aquincola sp.]|uniref:LysR family transcriptional regulator n=1 Tax=uncultured Aquincola sp. TaxID=886556 RepID=UPI0032B0F5A2|nr:LysR family transcriptional regulator [Aquincola sp.]|tara:strand:- start:111 stop:1082 length:972 start_codon:yes stop_codon:yes gene_type:complete
MRFNKLDLNLLVCLDALLTECSITRAAERVHLSQSAMSNALGRLRDYFEDDLLVQVGRQMELTPRATVLCEAVRDVLVRIETSLSAQPEFDCTSSSREFKIFVSDYAMEVLMPEALALASRQRSRVRWRLLPHTPQPARALERGEADLLVVPQAFCSADHPTDLLFHDEFVCAVWKDSSHARVGVNAQRYANARHVVMQPVDADQPLFDSWFVQQCNIHRQVEVSTYSFAMLPFLVVGTELIATVHACLARRVEPALPIVLMPMPVPMPSIEMAMQWHRYRTRDPGLLWLRALLREAAGRVFHAMPVSAPPAAATRPGLAPVV